MNLVIDASNIVAGGGLVHLTELLRHGDPVRFGFQQVTVCAPRSTLLRLEERPWLEKHDHPLLNEGYAQTLRWRKKILQQLVKEKNAFLFVPGSLKPPFRWPFVTMCQNLLPLELREVFRFGFSKVTLRLLLLRIFHVRAYKHAKGVIFLTEYCFRILSPALQRRITNHVAIAHGINADLFPNVFQWRSAPKEFRLVYVSIIDTYKHQDRIARAVISLNRKGHAISLTLVGPHYAPYLKKVNKVIDEAGVYKAKVTLAGSVPHERMQQVYAHHDAFIFGSTCETFGMILTEAMASGMPIACSERSSLPETLGQAGIYFDPLDEQSIERVILELTQNDELRKTLSAKASARAQEFSWGKCAEATFHFLSTTAKGYEIAAPTP